MAEQYNPRVVCWIITQRASLLMSRLAKRMKTIEQLKSRYDQEDGWLRIEFESWIRVHAPLADFTLGVRDEYIVRHLQGEWEAFVQGFVRGDGSRIND